jgi:hypothetical protein
MPGPELAKVLAEMSRSRKLLGDFRLYLHENNGEKVVSRVLTVFTLTSARSGTHFLYELVGRNARDCVARHETYAFKGDLGFTDSGRNPSMFGRPIYDRAVGQRDYTRKLLARKSRIIERCGKSAYVETSHAFLKSWSDLAPEYFPLLKLVHLVREPLKVAKSEAYRELLLHRLRVMPLHYRGGDGRKYFRWTLTGLEPIFQHFDSAKLTRLQWYLLQWIEIENRAMQFLGSFDKQGDCMTLHSPQELNNEGRVRELFEFTGLTLRPGPLDLHGRQNRNPRATVIIDDDRRELAEIVRGLPAEYLAIFRREPYAAFPWVECLHR